MTGTSAFRTMTTAVSYAYTTLPFADPLTVARFVVVTATFVRQENAQTSLDSKRKLLFTSQDFKVTIGHLSSVSTTECKATVPGLVTRYEYTTNPPPYTKGVRRSEVFTTRMRGFTRVTGAVITTAPVAVTTGSTAPVFITLPLLVPT